ncbi:MAG: beta-lactamase family protein [Oscillospiraceae bacterium]|jgi:CubicO group peptidase (beta-lactamase class C family)|nr:beta-lactamase family protein [Oscillospiraceae bacterium]
MDVISGRTDCRPADVDYDASRIDVLNGFFAGMIADKKIQSASYCISRRGKVFAHGSLGALRFRGDDAPMLPDSIFRIASVSKTFTAVAIMKLVEDGLLRLDSNVADILPQFEAPPFDRIKVWHLLTHTSGLHPDSGCFNYKYVVSPWEHIARKEKEDGINTDWISAGLSVGLRRDVGTEWQYCSFGYILLGAVVSAVAGVPATDYIRNSIIKPLNLADTDFGMTPDMALRAAYNVEHIEREVHSILHPGKVKEASVWDHIDDTGGGIYSTARDLNRFGNMMLGNGRLDSVRILGRKSVEKMTTNALQHIPDHCWGHEYEDRWYGMGFDMLSANDCLTTPGHYFHEGAGGCALVIDPAEDMVAAWSALYTGGAFQGTALYNAQNIMWSGLN